jgi:transcriptional regulator with XRE-family HTH domain
MNVSLGERVQLLRQRRELTQQELADEAAVSKMTILRIEKGKVTNVQLKTLRALAKVLGVAVEALLDEPHETDEHATREKAPGLSSPQSTPAAAVAPSAPPVPRRPRAGRRSS